MNRSNMVVIALMVSACGGSMRTSATQAAPTHEDTMPVVATISPEADGQSVEQSDSESEPPCPGHSIHEDDDDFLLRHPKGDGHLSIVYSRTSSLHATVSVLRGPPVDYCRISAEITKGTGVPFVRLKTAYEMRACYVISRSPLGYSLSHATFHPHANDACTAFVEVNGGNDLEAVQAYLDRISKRIVWES